MKSSLVLAQVLLMSLGWWSAPAHAGWSEPQVIARGHVIDLATGTTPDGQPVTVWTTAAVGGDPLFIKVGSAPAMRLTAEGDGESYFNAPTVVPHPDGRVTTVWVGETGNRHSIRSRTWTPGSGLGAEVVVSGAARSSRDDPSPFADPRAVVDGDGDVVVLWRGGRQESVRNVGTRTFFADGTVGDPQWLDAWDRAVSAADLLVAEDGGVEVVYSVSSYPDAWLEVRAQDASGRFGAARRIGDGLFVTQWHDATGRGAVVSATTEHTSDTEMVTTFWITVREMGGTWRAPRVVVSGSNLGVGAVTGVLMDGDDRVHALVSDRSTALRTLVTLRPDGSHTERPRVVTRLIDYGDLYSGAEITVDRAGRLLLVWTTRAGIMGRVVPTSSGDLPAASLLVERAADTDRRYSEQQVDLRHEVGGGVSLVWGTYSEPRRGGVYSRTWY